MDTSNRAYSSRVSSGSSWSSQSGLQWKGSMWHFNDFTQKKKKKKTSFVSVSLYGCKPETTRENCCTADLIKSDMVTVTCCLSSTHSKQMNIRSLGSVPQLTEVQHKKIRPDTRFQLRLYSPSVLLSTSSVPLIPICLIYWSLSLQVLAQIWSLSIGFQWDIWFEAY